MTIDETFDVGVDTRTPVDDKDYQVPFRFTGTLDKLTYQARAAAAHRGRPPHDAREPDQGEGLGPEFTHQRGWAPEAGGDRRTVTELSRRRRWRDRRPGAPSESYQWEVVA